MVIDNKANVKKKLSAKSRKKKLISMLIFVVINIAVISYMAIKEFCTNSGQVRKIDARNLNMLYLFAAVICFVIAVLMETIKYYIMIRIAENRSDFKGAIQCAILGKYYDNITPLGAGGQPFQIYFLNKRGFSIGTSAALPIAGYLSLHISFALLAVSVFLLNSKIVDNLPVIKYSAYIGIVFYLLFPVCIVLFIIMPKFLSSLISGFLKLLIRLHIFNDYKKRHDRIISSLNEYRSSIILLTRKPFILFGDIFFSLIFQISILSIPFFVLRAFGGSNRWSDVFSLVIYIYAAITFIPTPGNSGAAEGSFYSVFSSLSSGYLFWAVLVWRGLCFYGWLVLGLALYGRRTFSGKKTLSEEKEHDGIPSSAQFIDVYYPVIDGVVRTVNGYASNMCKETKCIVVCPKYDKDYKDFFEYKVIRVPTLRIIGMAYRDALPYISGKLRRYLESNRFDVFHVHSPFAMGRFGMSMGKRLNIPVIATFHSKYYDDVLNITHSRFLAKTVTRSIVKFYNKADAVWACSEATAKTLRSYGFNKNITVMNNGTDYTPATDEEKRNAREKRTKLGIPEDKNILLFVGHQIWQKNLRLVLDVSKFLKDRNSNFFTVIVGGGYNQDEIMEYARGLCIENSVMFTGHISEKSKLRQIYLASDLFFFPSLYDNAPLVLREAAMLELPALLVKNSNAAEPIKDGFNGYVEENDIIKMADRIEKIFSEGGLPEVGKNAGKTIPISWSSILLSTKEEYRNVISSYIIKSNQ